MKNIVLIGFMAAGKTVIGKRLADVLDKEFIDTDRLIEEKAGLSIAEIFSRFGEKYFRTLEKEIVEEISHYRDKVIATGGGIVLKEENRSLLRQSAIVFYLQAAPEEIFRRLKKVKDDERPLLKNKAQEKEIKRLLKVRSPLYKKCSHHIINTTDIKQEEVVKEILVKMRE